MADVVNVKVKFIRPEGYDNLREWCDDPRNVYIGRRGVVFIKGSRGKKYRYPPRDSKWSNPFKMKKMPRGEAEAAGREAKRRYERKERARVIREYEGYIREKILEDPDTYRLRELKGKNLGCWCAPEPCHGDVLMKLMEECGWSH